MSPNRIVAVLTPLVFAPLAGAITAWLADHFPGVEVSASSLEEIFIAGALIALAPAAQWLHGWQKFEARQAEAETAVALANAPAPAAPAFEEELEPEELAEPEAVGEEDEFDGLAGLAGVDAPEEAGELDELDDLDELDELDELEALDEPEEPEEREEAPLADDEQPAPAGG
jgi:hypothetical protein